MQSWSCFSTDVCKARQLMMDRWQSCVVIASLWICLQEFSLTKVSINLLLLWACNNIYSHSTAAGLLVFHIEPAVMFSLKRFLVSEYCFLFCKLPSCTNPSSCLVKLSHLELYVIDMDEQSMQTLGGLPELRHLVLLLTTESTVTVTNIATDGCFQKLRSCKFIYSRALYSMVQLALNDDCSVSFTLWNGRDDVVFACLALERRISVEEHHPSCRTLKRSRLRSTRSGAWGNAKRRLSWFMQSMFISITLLLIGRCLMKIFLRSYTARTLSHGFVFSSIQLWTDDSTILFNKISISSWAILVMI